MKNIIFDLDGTILENDNSLSAETVDCIRKASDKNIVTIATGRSLVGLPKSIQDIGDYVNYYITSNGTAIYDSNKEIIYSDVIQSKEVKSFLCEILNNNNLVVEILSNGGWHIDEAGFNNFKRVDIKPSVMDYIIRTRTKHYSLIEYLLGNCIEIEKISINLCSPISDQLKTSIYELCNKNGLKCFSEHPHKIDVFKKTTNKGSAISFLSKYIGVSLNDTISFGNDQNDIEMFEKSYVSICMPNGTREAKSHSDLVLRNNDSKRIKRAFRILKARGICLE